MKLRDHILARIQQNKLDRAKHQELVESLDRGAIYLQGQLDLVDEIEKNALDAQAAAKKALDEANAPAPAPEAPAAPEAAAADPAPASSDASAPEAAPIELSPLPAAPASDDSSSSQEASPAPASN